MVSVKPKKKKKSISNRKRGRKKMRGRLAWLLITLDNYIGVETATDYTSNVRQIILIAKTLIKHERIKINNENRGTL